MLVLLLQLWCCCCCYNSSAAAAATTAAAALLPLAAGCRLLPTGYYCRWLLATDYVLFYPIEYRSGTSPKPGSNVLFPSALPLASAGVGGFLYLGCLSLYTEPGLEVSIADVWWHRDAVSVGHMESNQQK